MITRVLMMCASMALVTTTAQAEAGPWVFAGANVGYGQIDANDNDYDVGVFEFFAGYKFDRNFAAEVSFFATTRDEQDNNGQQNEADLNGFTISGTAALPLTRITSLYARVGYSAFELDSGDDGVNDDGFLYGVGARFQLSEAIALSTEVRHIDLNENNDFTTGLVGLTFHRVSPW